jgi:hypothetical protein
MLPHTKYHWPISKVKNVMARAWPLTSRSNNCFLNSIFLHGVIWYFEPHGKLTPGSIYIWYCDPGFNFPYGILTLG